MKYFITGGCGFIGTNLALSFNQKNYKDILILDNLLFFCSIKNTDNKVPPEFVIT